MTPSHQPDHHRTSRAAMQSTHQFAVGCQLPEKSITKFKWADTIGKCLFPLWLQICNISCNSIFIFLQFVYMYIIIYPFSLQSNVLLHGKSVTDFLCAFLLISRKNLKGRLNFMTDGKDISLKVWRAMGTGIWLNLLRAL